MIKQYLLVFTLAFGCVGTMAQSITGGVFAGLSATQVDGDDLAGYNKAGVIAGGVGVVKFNRKAGLQMEIMYIQKGSTQPINPIDNSFYKLSLSYVEVPVLYKYHYSDHLAFDFGPSYGFLVGHSEENQNGSIVSPAPFKPGNWNLNIGISTPMSFLSNNLIADLRFSYGVTPIRNFTDNASLIFDNGQYNNVIAITLKYVFNNEW